MGDEVLFYKAPPRKSCPRRHRPAKVLLLDASGAAFAFQGQTFKVARHGVRKKVRASVDPEASCDDAFGDLCRLTHPREALEQPPNPPWGSPDLYGHPDPILPRGALF